ncbi:hypothetical protein ACFL0Y_02240 [Patescibacteria group bacterium]
MSKLKKIQRFSWWLIKASATLILTLLALLVLAAFFWTKAKIWLVGESFMGNDTGNYIHYVIYYLKNPHFPINAWDHLWHNGVPRMIDLTWIHFTLNSLLAKTIGVFRAVKIYPLIFLGSGAFFVYLLFYELSRSVLISLGLAISFVLGQGYYAPLYEGGVVLSSISQMFLPAQLYFLARFAKRGGYRNLILGALTSILGLGTHGLMMMFFGFIPAFIFVLFTNRESNSLISKRTMVIAFIFAAVTLITGAVFVLPSLLHAVQGGSTIQFIGEKQNNPETLKTMFSMNDPGIAYGYVAAVVIAGIFWLFKKKPEQVVRPALIILLIYALFMISYTFGGNPLFGVLFPGRFYWVWSLVVGVLASALLAPLSKYKAKKFLLKVSQFLGFGMIKVVIFGLIIFNPIISFGVFSPETVYRFTDQLKFEGLEDIDVFEEVQRRLKGIVEQIDINDDKVRFWTHDQSISIMWVAVSNMPLSEGYAHIWTYYSRLWEGWFYGVMSGPNWESQEVPREMAKQQGLFFIDWYGIKYLTGDRSVGEWGIAGHFLESPPYIIKESKVGESLKSVFTVSPDYTSPLVSAVKAPVLGFVGDDEAYMTFLKDLAMLNLNTSYLIPVKVSETIGKISAGKLSFLDGLVIYDFKKGGLSYGSGWRKINNFVKEGGRVWIEGGGNSGERESDSLPEVFPITSSQYGPLEQEWQPGGELVDQVDFSTLKPLAFRDTIWQVSYAPEGTVKSGAKVLLSQKNYPVAVEQNIGQGKVIWTGVNFWYRPEEYRQNGMNEIVFVELLLDRLFDGLSPNRIGSKVERPSPEHIVLTGQDFSGVTVKENHWQGWKAMIEANGKKKKIPVFTAGPEMMYVPVPQDLRSGEIKVMIDYKGELAYWLYGLVSLISFFVVIMVLFFGKFLTRRFRFLSKDSGSYKNIKMKIGGWWDSDEH